MPVRFPRLDMADRQLRRRALPWRGLGTAALGLAYSPLREQCDIGSTDDVIQRIAPLELGESHADRTAARGRGEVGVYLLEARAYVLGADPGQRADELVAAYAHGYVVGTHMSTDQLGDTPQQLIAH